VTPVYLSLRVNHSDSALIHVTAGRMMADLLREKTLLYAQFRYLI
jgi:hypothetical protein